MIVQICVGSSCHLKGSEKLVELFQMFQKAVDDYNLGDEVTLAGSFCTGKCNRVGVTVTVDDDVFTGVTPDNFSSFFNDKVLNKINEERK